MKSLYLMHSLFMNKYFLHLLFFLKLSIFLRDTTVSLLPILWSLLITFSHINNSFKDLNLLTHTRVQLLLHCVQVIVQELSKANKKGKRLVEILSL